MMTRKVSKTSVKASLKTFRRLALALGLFLIAQMGWGETYYWIGGGADNNWTTVENWSTTEGATPGTGTACPGAGDEVHIYGDVEVTIDDDISIGTLLIEAGNAHFLNSSFTTTLSGSGSLTITDTGADAINLTRCSSTDGVIGTLAINLPVTCKGTIQTHSGTTLSVVSGLTAANLIHSAGNGVPVSKIQVNGPLNLGTGTLNLSGNGNPGANQLVVESGGSVKAGTIEFGQTAYQNTGISNPIINNGTIEVSSSFTIPNFTSGVTIPYSGNGTIELNGTNATFSNNDDVDITITTLKGDQSSVVSGGSHTTIVTADFDAAVELNGTIITTADFAGAAQLGNTTSNTIENATFHDDITLSGENTFQNLTATGLGGKTLTVNAEQTFQSGGTVTLSGTGDSNLLTVTGNGSGKFTLGTSILTGEYLSLDTDSSVVSDSTGTAFAQSSETTGSGTTSWIVTSAGGHLWNGENGNWETAANWLPQSVPATTDEVIINSGTPKINSAVTVKSITVNGGGINLLSDSLSVEALTLAASTSVTAAVSTTINITEGQEIDEKITGPGKLVLASGKNYTIPPSTTIGIDIENNGSLSSTGAVTFSGDFTNTGSATFSGGLSIAGDLEGTGSLTGTITFNGSGDQTFSPNNVIYPSITVDKSAGTLSVDSSLQVTALTFTSGAVSIAGDLTLWDGTDYQNYDFSSLTNTLTFTGGSSASPRVLTAAAITNSSKIYADYLKLQTQGSSDITLNSCENISNLTLETSGNISVNGITADSLSIASGAASVKMKDTITLNSTSQDFIINYPLLLTDDTTFSIIKDIKVQDTGSIKSDASAGKNLSLTANTIQLLNGNALGDSSTGALGTISIYSNFTLGADTQFFSSQINFAGTGAKYLSGAYKLSASGNVSDTGAWTWDTGSTLLFNGSADQTFKTNTNSTYKDIAVNKTTGNFVIDTSVLKADNLTITDCEEIHFTGVNEITTVGNLSFPRPITADNNLTISNTSGNVSFANTFNSTGNLNITDASVTFTGDVTAAVISTKATTINCSEIQTSGNQNYAGAVTLGADTELESSSGSISFTSTVDGANTLKLTSSTGTNFSGNVGASTSLTSLEINGTSNINCASITTSDDQTYNGTVNLAAGGTTTITGANTGAHIDFKDTINGSNTFSVNATSATFENTVGETTALASLEVTGIATINCSSIKTSDLQTYNDEIILQQNSSFIGSLITINGSVSDNTTPPASSYELTVNGNTATALGNSETISIPVQINGNLTNANTGTASFNNDIKVSADVTDNGSWNSADGKKLIFNGTGAQKFTPVAATTYQSILIDKTAGSFTTATNALQVGSFADSAANASTITFATNTTIGSAVELHTSKDVSFTNTTNVLTTASPNVYHNITHEKGITNLSGTVTAANITLHKANLTDATTLIAHGDVEFKNIGTSSYANIYGSNDLTITIDTGKSVTFNGEVGKAGKPIPTALTINGNTNIKCTLIATSGTQSYNGNVNLYSNSTNSSVTLTTNTSSEIDFSGDISEDSSKQIKLTIDSPVFNSTATAGNSSSITVNELEFLQDASIHSANITAINLTVPTISGTGKTVTLAASVSELSFSGNVEFNPNITTAASSNFKASSGTMTFKADVNFADNTLAANDGTIILTAANKNPAGTAAILSGNNTFKILTLQGPVTLSGTNTITDLNIQDSVTISAGNTIINLTANKTDGLGGKTITFGAGTEQTVSGVLTLKGSTNTDGNRLNLRSSSDSGSQWKIKCTGANSHDIEFVDVQDGWNTSETGTPTPEAYNLFAITSNDSGNNTNWNFPGMVYTWNGSANNSWNTASNWTPSSIPGKGADVRIASVTSPASTLLLGSALDLTSTYKGTDYNGIITVNAGAVFDLAGNNLTVGKITNKGLLRLTGASTQTIQTTMENNGSDSTVEYYGTGSANSNFAWDGDNGAGTTGKQYTNLIISRAMSQNTDEANKLDVSGKTTIIAGSTNSVSLDNEHNIFGGHVTLGNQSTSTSAGIVTLNGTGTAGVAIFLEENVLAQNLILNSNVQGENLSINSLLTLNAANVTTTGTQTYNNAVILGTANEHTLSGTEITFATNGTINGEAKLTLSGTSKNVLNADVGGTNAVTSLSVTGPVQINCAQIKTTGAQTYGDTVTLGKSGNITLTAKNSLDEYQTVQFNQNVSSATSVTPNLIIDANTSINCSAVTVTGTQTYNGNVQIDAAATIKASEIDFAKDISGSGKKLTIDSPIIKSTISSGVAEITLSELAFGQTSTLLEATNNTNINLNVPNIKGAGKTIVIDESLKNITLTPTAVTVEPTVQTETNSKLTASSGTTTFKADVTLANATLDANGGTIILTGSGSTLSGNNTFKNLIVQDSLTINGSNKIENFTAGTSTAGLGGKTITFGANTTQEVTGKLTLRGTANTDRLNLRSSIPTTTSATGTPWKIDCTGSNAHDIEFVDIQDSNNITSSYYLFALNSIDHGNNTKWNFPGMKYEWTGADSTDPTNWNVAANWEYLSIPGKGADIEIPAGCTNYPTLRLALDLNETYNSTSYKGKITVAANAQFDLAGQNLTLGEIANNGLVRLFGTQTIAATMSNSTDSSVEYYDSDPAAILTSFVWDGDGNSEAGKKYYNLIINKNVTQATATGEQLKVSGTTTISAGSGKTVTLNNASNVFTGHVIIGNSAATPQVNAGAVILNGSATSSSAIYLENNILADSLTLNSNVQGGELTITAPLTINTAAVTSTGNQTYKSPVTLSHDVNFTAASGKLIKFENTVSGSGGEKLTTSTGNSQFDGNVNNLSSLTTDATVTLNADVSIASITTQAVNINTASITTSGLQTYNGAVTLGADTTLTSTGDNIALNTTLDGAHTITFSVPDNTTNTITVVGKVGGDSSIATPPSITIAQAGTVTFKETVKANALTLTKANSTTFEKAVDITTFADDATEHSGTVTFAAGGTIQNDVTFNTNNIVSFTGTMNVGTVVARKNLTHTAGNTAIKGTLTAATTQLGNLTLTGDTTITTTGTQTYNGTINDASAGAHTLTLNSGTSQITFASDVGQTAAPKVLTVNGPLAINCAAVTTSDQQNYNAAITSSGAITLKSAALNLNCSTVTTADSQTYDGPVNLLSDTSLTLTTGDLLLKSPLAGAHKFTIAKTNDATFDDTVTVTGFEITLANDTQFANPVAVTNFAITSANDTHFADTLTADSFSISQAANTIFNGAVTIASITDAATAGNISFNAGGTISSDTGTSFLTTDTVTFGDNQSDIMTFGSASPYADITHTAGNTSITGLLNAANITLAQTAGGPMTIANSGLFKTIDGAALTYTTSFAQTGTGNSVIGGSFTGNGNASFATNVQISGTAPADFGSSGTAVSITKNLIILRNTSDDLNINSRVNVTENLVLYKGPVVTNADITAGKDILVLGSTYSTSDTSTGITNEYAYACVRPVTWSQPNYTETLLPDATPVPELVEGPLNDFTATLSVASGTTISAAKNFYANGTTLQTSGSTGQWTLKLPDLTNAASAFAEAYYSEISGCKVICNDGSSTNGTKSRLVCLECDDTGTTNTPNTNVDFDDFEITAAYTERDNAIRVEFNRPLRFNSYTVDLLKFHDSSDAVSAGTNFTGLYADPDCQTPIEIGDNAYDYFYIKAAPQDSAETGAWNTDATGKTSGASDGQSTDRNGKHHTALPCLDFPRALQASASGQTYTVPFILTDIWGKRLNNYSRRVTKGSTAEAAYGSANSSNDLLDKTGPVLWKVRTGQELHNGYDTSTGQASEHSYDAHNFIEFLYSEKVDFDGDETTNAPLNADPATAENVKVTGSFGALQNSNIEIAGALNFAGLGTIQNGLLWTGSAGVTSKEVNALYRKGTNAEYSIRLSIAGYTEGTVTDPDGNTYKKWIGYIEKAQMPTGTVTHIADSNTFVKDKEGNPQIKYEALNMIPEVDSTEDGLYGKWDLSEPVFAPVRQNKKTVWESQLFQKDYQAEAVGNNSGVGSTLDRIEFHLYDNTPDFDDDGNAVTGTPEWFSEVGWCALGSDGEKATDLYKAYTYAADIFGGARPFDSNTQRRTQGGIRYSTLHSAVNAFKYGINSGLSESNVKTSFDNSKNTWGGASSLIFTGSSSPRRSAGDLEGLYFALPLANTSLDIKTSFTIKYDEKTGFVTDLAGNRLRTKIISTIDRTPPSIDMTVCPVGGDDLQIIFVKELCTDSRELNYIDGSGTKVEITEDFESLITECIDFIKIDSSGSPTVVSNLKIDNTSPAVIEFEENQNGSFFTKIKFKLNRKVTLEDVKNTFIRIIYTQKYGEYSVDLFTGHSGSRVTFIQDENGNNIQMYTAHALSDFAVGVIDPLYAYDSAMIEEDDTIISDSLLHQNLTEDVDRDSWSVHDWNRDQKNYGTLPAKRPLAIVADTTDGTLENTDAPASFRLYLSNNPDKDSVSTQYNKDLEPDPQWRIWLPNEMTGVFTSLSEKNNENYSQVDGTLLSDDKSNRLIFDIGETITNQWTAGNQISFLFGLTNSDGSPVTIMHSPELDINNDKQYLPTSAKMPLFALRQTEPDDLLALDLWSFRLKDVVSQRGGVTILNNVINSSQREKVVVKVNQPQQGNLTVLVMTLDGSIVDYLHRGSSDAGEHFYSWDGSNRRGHSVARGMYFIRVTGPGIDETRKVMVVKD